jgi:hypothetical protein
VHSDNEAPDLAEPGARIFISYSRKNMAFVDRIDAGLRVRGFAPLIDRAEIYAFEDWWRHIENLIVSADTIIFVLSPDAVASEVAAREVAFAASLNKRFAPIVCTRVDDVAVPESLRHLNFVFFDEPTQFEQSLDRLAEALSVDLEWVRKHTEFGEHGRRWAAAGRPGQGGLMLRPPLLDHAEAWQTFRPRGAPEPTEETQAFIAASRVAFEQEEAAGKEQLNRRLISESRRLTALAREYIAAGDSAGAMALALEALPDEAAGAERPYIPEAEEALFNAYRSLREAVVLKVCEPGYHTTASFTRDGTRIATGSRDGKVRIWDAATGELVLSIDTSDCSTNPVVDVAFTPDGAHVAAWRKSGRRLATRETGYPRLLIWNAATGEPFAQFGENVAFVVFGPASRGPESHGQSIWKRFWQSAPAAAQPSGANFRALVGSADGKAWIFDIRTGAMLLALNGP